MPQRASKFPWYEDVSTGLTLEQGDIIENCHVLVAAGHHYATISQGQSSQSVEIDCKILNCILLSQSCDIINNKIDSVIACAIWPLATLISTDPYYKGSAAREDLRQGKVPAYHLLNKFALADGVEDFYFVDFRHIYSVPKAYVEEVVKVKERKRLLPPYREHLSQSFARYFMRVGLPSDIEASAIKQYPLF